MLTWILRILSGEFFLFRFKDEPSPPQAPAPVDPSVQIAAQAKAQPSYYGPAGSRVYSGDPNVAGSYRVDEKLTPEQLALFNGRNEVAQQLLTKSANVLNATPYTYKYAGKSLPDTFSFNGATDPATNQFFTAQKALLDPVWAKERERLDQRLANQGLPTGSAGNESAADYERSQFEKSRASAYEQAAADALEKGYGQALSTRGQQFNEANQSFSQDVAQRQQNLNEIAQALGGSQLTPVGQAGSPVDVAGPYALNQAQRQQQYQGELAGYNAGVASNNSTMGGLFSLGAAAIPLFSDRRLKRDVVALGEVMPGIGWYAFRYIWDAKESPIRTGVMADEVERLYPEAVLLDASGFLMVDYGALFAGRTVH